MTKTDFKGRSAELQLLDALWESPQAALLILYGRRRVGKTRLLTHWRERHSERALYWVAEPTSAFDQLRSFSQALYNFAYPDTPAPLDFTYSNWDQALQQVAAMAEEQRLALFIDEVTYLMDVDPAIAGTLQKAWDHWLSKSNLMLALAGSQMGLMQKKVLSYQAPLYGRSTAQIKLPPLPFAVTQQFFPHYTARDRVSIYAIWGGIPAYWERLDTTSSVMENVRVQLLTSNTLMQEEPRLLLQDFISDPHNYVGIMRAVAYGADTQNDISRHTGLSQGHISKYLSVLRETGFVERRVPVTETLKKSRRGRYFITDPYLRFYYRFLSTYQTQLALGAQQQALTYINTYLPEFIQTSTWQDLSRDWLLGASAHGEFPLMIEDVGASWTRKHMFDVVGISRTHKTLVLGNCYWNAHEAPVDASVIQELASATTALVPKQGKWKVYYLIFAAGGWTQDAAALAEALPTTAETQSNWEVTGARLLALEDIERDLVRWSTAGAALDTRLNSDEDASTAVTE